MSTIKKAYIFAQKKHGDQLWDGKPYMKHLELVAEELIKSFPSSNAYIRSPYHEIIICAYLHDVLEDTDATEDEIRDLFGENVLAITKLLTHASRDKYEALSHDAMATQVKIADRIVNLRKTNENRSMKHYWKYLRETPDFVGKLNLVYGDGYLYDAFYKELGEAKRYFYLTITAQLGISKQAVYKWLTGKSNPTYRHIKKLKELGIDLLM